MILFNFGKKKNKKKEEKVGIDPTWLDQNALETALKDLGNANAKIKKLEINNKALSTKNGTLRKEKQELKDNLNVLQNTMESIKKICNSSKGTTVSKKQILKELGE